MLSSKDFYNCKSEREHYFKFSMINIFLSRPYHMKKNDNTYIKRSKDVRDVFQLVMYVQFTRPVSRGILSFSDWVIRKIYLPECSKSSKMLSSSKVAIKSRKSKFHRKRQLIMKSLMLRSRVWQSRTFF